MSSGLQVAAHALGQLMRLVRLHQSSGFKQYANAIPILPGISLYNRPDNLQGAFPPARQFPRSIVGAVGIAVAVLPHHARPLPSGRRRHSQGIRPRRPRLPQRTNLQLRHLLQGHLRPRHRQQAGPAEERILHLRRRLQGGLHRERARPAQTPRHAVHAGRRLLGQGPRQAGGDHCRRGKSHCWQELIRGHLYFVTVANNLRRLPFVPALARIVFPSFQGLSAIATIPQSAGSPTRWS
ncbi:uncharacterized protein DSM5745_08181 [Aspergillus mulundensis]|uniref:Uncharacterized protein n=1 Tax=Aspergillus mulundensis TaxID=1810919 RepID=A0A3D8R9N7_9EURO|nr:hypothetical protein DSM5745_08181 [Aspergillus mulundensis]RDW70670.1 hypothetical protein DSM5745_08181 [Aspergillus mulundensis]